MTGIYQLHYFDLYNVQQAENNIKLLLAKTMKSKIVLYNIF